MLHSFTRNHDDLSTDAGFQYEFFCDCCGNGFKSTFKPSSTYSAKKRTEGLGRGIGILGNLFGGRIGSISGALESGANVLQDKLGDKSHQWRKEQEQSFDEAAEKATVWHGEIEERTTLCPHCGKPAGNGNFCNHCGQSLRMLKCPKCGATLQPNMKFCGECGTPVGAKNVCPKCGTENEPGTKFCGECGAKL